MCTLVNYPLWCPQRLGEGMVMTIELSEWHVFNGLITQPMDTILLMVDRVRAQSHDSSTTRLVHGYLGRHVSKGLVLFHYQTPSLTFITSKHFLSCFLLFSTGESKEMKGLTRYTFWPGTTRWRDSQQGSAIFGLRKEDSFFFLLKKCTIMLSCVVLTSLLY